MIEYKGNLVLGVPKTGSQSLAVYLMGRQLPYTHKLYSEYDRQFFSVYAIWRDPVDRFKSSVRFKWRQQQKANARLSVVSEIVANLADEEMFFHPQSIWLDEVPEDKLVLLPFEDYEYSVNYIATSIGLNTLDTIPRIFETSGEVGISDSDLEKVKEFYKEDYKYLSCLKTQN
jgi:hypothetical protein